MPRIPTLVGSDQHDVLTGQSPTEFVVGLAGDDTITTGSGADMVFGDFVSENMLQTPEGALSFGQYAAQGDWTVSEDDEGRSQMSQTVETSAGAHYEISFELAANHASGAVSGALDVLWNGTVIGSVDTSSAIFASQILSFVGTGGAGELTFRARPSEATEGPEIHTSGPIFWYEKSVSIGGSDVTVQAFAEGQNTIYQVLNGQLHAYDPIAETYTPAGAAATVVTNCIGFNQEDDLIYGIAVANGVDSRGNAVAQSDLVMIDAGGYAYRVGETPYRSWTGDFDAAGNLWAFQSSMDRLTMIDVSDRDAEGNPRTETFKFPSSMITDQVWDVAFDTATQSFYGLVRPRREGEDAKLMKIDISEVANGGLPEFSVIPVTATEIDGVEVPGVPAITFGAFVIDGDGNFYAGGNGGDHDMNDNTRSSGGIYRVKVDPDGEEAQLVLAAAAPKSYSNDGAVDPRAMDPFAEPDPAALVLLRGPELTSVPDPAQTYDDLIETAAGADSVEAGYGADTVIGAGRGDSLSGGEGNDHLYGGAGPDANGTLLSSYDAAGLRYAPDGTLLPENDDLLQGNAGDDYLSGAAGHDTLEGGTGVDTLVGGTGHDVMTGGEGADELSGGSEDDNLSGNAGADTLLGGQGDDTLNGGADDDALSGNSGDDLMSGESGNDTLDGADGNDTANGGEGNDLLNGNSGDDLLSGGTGNDTLNGATGNDTADGGEGDDVLNGNSGNDLLSGGAGNDTLSGATGDDTTNGGEGDDVVYGHSGNDLLSGDAGADTVAGGIGDDTVLGGSGDDVLTGITGNDVLYGEDGDDDLNGGTGNDTLDGGDGRDTLNGSSGDDSLTGGADRDKLTGHTGNDTMDGGTGNDYLNGGSGNDHLSGGSDNDTLTGYHGDDTLLGGDGDDTLILGRGYDMAFGGDGDDTFVFASRDMDGRSNTIADFSRETGNADAMDLRDLNILDTYTEADWLAQFVGQTADGDVTVQLNTTTLLFTAHGETIGGTLYDAVVEGLWL